jgi:hypothetical protein
MLIKIKQEHNDHELTFAQNNNNNNNKKKKTQLILHIRNSKRIYQVLF